MSEPPSCPECGGDNFFLKGWSVGTTRRNWKCRLCNHEWETDIHRTVDEFKEWLEQFPDNFKVGVYEGEVSCITLHDPNSTDSFSFFTHERAPTMLNYPFVGKDPDDDVYHSFDTSAREEK